MTKTKKKLSKFRCGGCDKMKIHTNNCKFIRYDRVCSDGILICKDCVEIKKLLKLKDAIAIQAVIDFSKEA